jgi:tRNA modification GTPase
VPSSDTIFALSSGQGRAGVAVVRVSGPAAGSVLDLMAPPRPKPRYAALRRVKHPQTGEILDDGLALWFPGPRSETGEDMAELQVHGGRAVIGAVLGAIGTIAGCRLAEPGEFARRAFEHGKLDLTGVEGLADLIDAETAAQRRQALRQADGALSKLYAGWRQRLIEGTALLEAAIDFSDEADVVSGAVAQARERVEALQAEITRHLDDGHRGELIREGFQVVLAGPPNVGKSSLLNALARRDVAIVSEEAGTTRDVIEVKLDLDGLPIVVSDTAGIREAAGKVEEEGIRRTLARAQAADLVLWLVDAMALDAPAPRVTLRPDRLLVVVTKYDLLDAKVLQPLPEGAVAVSALTGFGLDRLTRRLAGFAQARMGGDEAPALTQARHRQQLLRCRAALATFLGSPLEEFELRAEDLRRAALALGRITGAVDPEEVLGEIFGRFCIGK